MEIRKIKKDEMKEALELVWKTFLEYEAPDYTEEGILEFRKTIENKEWISKRDFFGAFEENKILGVIAIKDYSHIALFFVVGNYHRRGIGKQLFQKVCELNKSGFYTVNSFPYAKIIYEHLGFKCLDNEQCINGLRFYPMINDDIFSYMIKG